ncbi:MAG: methyltransferase domain-containing protein [Candidatus Eisenbacteria bacterium]|nr:methyltransferase domain-containing protein [Candidatus Latescibacterota bacterium]MBD3303362.1 methyltransferase domain-containing protein [Candidatus Eisenbacteria bacterium]
MTHDPKVTGLMRGFWDRKARENATYYISSYRDYGDQDPEEFWRWGRILTERYLDESGIAFTGEETVLEVGCGIGRMTRALAERFARVVGVDISEEMITRGRQELADLDNVTLAVGNGVDLGELEDRSIDFVFSYIVLQHIPDARVSLGYIREFGRVLRPGARAYFQVNNLRSGLRGRLRLKSRLRAWIGGRGKEPENGEGAGPTGLDHPAWTGSRLTLPQIRRACAEGDLEIVSLKGEGTQYLWVHARKRAD